MLEKLLLGFLLIASISVLPSQALSAEGEDPQMAIDFERAKVLFDEGKESESLLSLTDFLRRYPLGERSARAQALIGEIYFNRREYSTALNALQKAIKMASVSADVMGMAAVRAGECHQKLNSLFNARVEWEAVRRRFSGTEAAQRAQNLLAEFP